MRDYCPASCGLCGPNGELPPSSPSPPSPPPSPPSPPPRPPGVQGCIVATQRIEHSYGTLTAYRNCFTYGRGCVPTVTNRLWAIPPQQAPPRSCPSTCTLAAESARSCDDFSRSGYRDGASPLLALRSPYGSRLLPFVSASHHHAASQCRVFQHPLLFERGGKTGARDGRHGVRRPAGRMSGPLPPRAPRSGAQVSVLCRRWPALL